MRNGFNRFLIVFITTSFSSSYYHNAAIMSSTIGHRSQVENERRREFGFECRFLKGGPLPSAPSTLHPQPTTRVCYAARHESRRELDVTRVRTRLSFLVMCGLITVIAVACGRASQDDIYG